MNEQATFGITLWATDVFALADFLEGVTGSPMTDRHPGFAALDVGGITLQIHDDESYRGHPWFDALGREGSARGMGAELRFAVADVMASYREALKRGGRAIAQPYEYEGTMECQVMGPDGYVLSLWQVWESSTTA